MANIQTIIDTVKAVSGVKSVNLHEASGRYYINLKGNGANFAGERNSKLYITKDGDLVVETGKGTTSYEYLDQRRAVAEAIGYEWMGLSKFERKAVSRAD